MWRKRSVAIIMTFVLFFTPLDMLNVIANTETAQQKCERTYEINQTLPPGVSKCNFKGARLNLSLLNNLGIVVYGDYSSIPGNDFKAGFQDPATKAAYTNPSEFTPNHPYYTHPSLGRGEYRYHGYTYEGQGFLNIYFIDDVKGQSPNNRVWIHKPWENPYNTSTYNPQNAGIFARDIILADNNEQVRNNLLKTIRSDHVQILMSYPSNANKENMYEFMYVQQAPTILTSGSGTMWSRSSASARTFYQTFEIPKLTGKNLLPVVAEGRDIEVNLANYVQETHIPVEVPVRGIYQDEGIWNDETQKHFYYTRSDNPVWELRINTDRKQGIQGAGNTGSHTFTVMVPKDQIREDMTYPLNITATAVFPDGRQVTGTAQHTVIFEADGFGTGFGFSWKPYQSLFTVTNQISFMTPEAFPAARLNYQDASRGDIQRYAITISGGSASPQTFSYITPKMDRNKQQDVNRDIHYYIMSQFDFNRLDPDDEIIMSFIVTQQIVTQDGNTDHHSENIEVKYGWAPPVSVIPDPFVPLEWFDIVDFPATDNTDMSTVANRSVFIDGREVNADLFFSGSYQFGIGQHGLRRITIVYESIDGILSHSIRWTMIRDTKPRVQFALDGNSFKENRRMTLHNTTQDANYHFVWNSYPVTHYVWEFFTVDGETAALHFGDMNTDMLKEFLYKTPGIYGIRLTGTNTLGRTSDPYEITFNILEDIPPAIVLHPFNSQIHRGQSVHFYYDVESVDEDLITFEEVRIYYDSNNDGSFDTLLETFDGPLTEYAPDRLGYYKVVAEALEEFGQTTLEQHVSPEDRKRTTVETWFMVDNLIPYTDLFTDIPYVRPKVDAFFMLDRNLAREKNNYVLSNLVTINNDMRRERIDPMLQSWDMHTYVYSQQANTSRHTGSQVPPQTISYTSGNYSGTLTKTHQVDNGSYHDFGRWRTVPMSDSYTAYSSCAQSGWRPYDAGDIGPSCPSSRSYSSGGYTGTLYEDGYWYDSWDEPRGDVKGFGFSRFHTYSGVVTKTWNEQVWEENWQWVANYTGFYSGTIYQYVRQPFNNPFNRIEADRYVIYISDNIVNDMSDLTYVMTRTDAQLILVGHNNIRTQIAHDYFIRNTGQPMEEILAEIVHYISSQSEEVTTLYTLLNESVEMYSIETDVEGDPIIHQEMMYIHDADYFDNSLGKADYAVPTFEESAWHPDHFVTSFEKPGLYQILRRVQDQPLEDPAFATFNYYSNIANLRIIAHRKPIANLTLDWDFDPTANIYLTSWVDHSYDLDHQYSREDKGIVDRRMKLTRNGNEIFTTIPETLEPGSYHLEYVVKDPEHVWSDPFTLNFTLQNAPPIQLQAKARTKLERFALNSIPITEELQLYDIWTRYPYPVRLEVAIYQGNTQRTPTKTVNLSASTGRQEGHDIYWNPIDYAIPETLPDGNYSLRITARGTATSATQSLNFPIRVLTPINLEVVDFPDPILVNQGLSYTLKAQTSKYANTAYIMMQNNSPSFRTQQNLSGTLDGYLKHWQRVYTPGNIAPGQYTALYYASTPNGNSETKVVNYEITRNRPPVPGFTVEPNPIYEGDIVIITSTAYDPDPNDSITQHYTIHYPDGSLSTYDQANFSEQLLLPGEHTITQTVTDSYGLSATYSRTLTVLPLTITGHIGHTAQWEEIHQQLNNPAHHFYSGEEWLLSALVSEAPAQRVYVSFTAQRVDGTLQEITFNLSQSHEDPLRYSYSYYNQSFMHPRTRLRNGAIPVTFTVIYENGTVKTDVVEIVIIGSAYEVIHYHRSY